MRTLKQRFTLRQIYEGQEIPRWYGIARRRYAEDYLEYSPIPINLIIRTYDSLKHKLSRWFKVPKPHRWEQELNAAYHRGYNDGKHQAIMDEFLQQVERRTRYATTTTE
jgi:hypothetical protein